MVVSEIYTQLAFKPPIPTADFSGKTVTVMGANVGLGKEAVKHFARLRAAKVIATARSAAKGATALAEIEAETKRTGVVEFWDLDYSSYASVKAFCARAAKLERLDAVVEFSKLMPKCLSSSYPLPTTPNLSLWLPLLRISFY